MENISKMATIIMWKLGSVDFMIRENKLIWQDETIPEPTIEEINQWEQDYLSQKVEEVIIIKEKRDKLLSETDIYLISDFPITTENLILIKAYRQELRDLPTIIDLDNPIYPIKPF